MVTKKILGLYDKLSFYRYRIPRLLDSRAEFKLKKTNLNCAKASKAEKQILEDYWGKAILKRLDTRYLSLYNTYNDNYDPRYIPDDLYYGTIDSYFNNAMECGALDDKNLYDLYFPDALQPKTIGRKVGGTFLKADYSIWSLQDMLTACQKEEKVIVKPTRLTQGGGGIFFWNKPEGLGLLKEKLEAQKSDFIIQGLIHQHSELSKLHPDSVNSIRILTLNMNGKVSVLSAIVRMGANGLKVDNGHSGGCFCGVMDDGRLRNVAFDYMTGKKFDTHPTTDAHFQDSIIPKFESCKQMVEKLAPRLGTVSRLTSWDLTVNESCQPMLIEVNLCYGGLFFHQMSNGPIFGEQSRYIIEKVLKEKDV